MTKGSFYHYGVLLVLVLSLQKDGRIILVDGRSTSADELPPETTYNEKVRRPIELLPHRPVERIVDRDAIKELEDLGVQPTDPDFELHPPGHEANLDEYPFFAYWSRVGCGASVVHNDILLTAAHCLTNAPDDHHDTRLFRLRNKYRGNWDDNGITRAIAHVEVHPLFDFSSKGAPSYDFLIVKLDSSVMVEENDDDGTVTPTGVQTVKLNRLTDRPSPGEELHAAGFGSVLPDGQHSPNSHVLMDVLLDTLPPKTCTDQYNGRLWSKMKPDNMFCVGTEDGTRDTCHGKSCHRR